MFSYRGYTVSYDYDHGYYLSRIQNGVVFTVEDSPFVTSDGNAMKTYIDYLESL